MLPNITSDWTILATEGPSADKEKQALRHRETCSSTNLLSREEFLDVVVDPISLSNS